MHHDRISEQLSAAYTIESHIMFAKLIPAAILFGSFFSHVCGHGLLTAVTGANGITGVGFGVDASTPRNGGLPIPFEVCPPIRFVTFIVV
jgi:hypothetical protein